MEYNIQAPTPHINAKKGDFAKTVLMPGDPKRSKYIAKNFLTNPVLVNDVRGIQGYTGKYKNKNVSVMASGMGMPSIAMYATELYTAFDVNTIIRVGTAGALQESINLKDIIIAVGASTDSNFADIFEMPGTLAPTAPFDMLLKAYQITNSMKLNKKPKFGNVITSNYFYNNVNTDLKWAKMDVLSIDMQTTGLYLIAEQFKKQCLSISTIANSLITGKSLSSNELETGLNEMIEVALEIALLC